MRTAARVPLEQSAELVGDQVIDLGWGICHVLTLHGKSVYVLAPPSPPCCCPLVPGTGPAEDCPLLLAATAPLPMPYSPPYIPALPAPPSEALFAWVAQPWAAVVESALCTYLGTHDPMAAARDVLERSSRADNVDSPPLDLPPPVPIPDWDALRQWAVAVLAGGCGTWQAVLLPASTEGGAADASRPASWATLQGLWGAHLAGYYGCSTIDWFESCGIEPMDSKGIIRQADYEHAAHFLAACCLSPQRARLLPRIRVMLPWNRHLLLAKLPRCPAGLDTLMAVAVHTSCVGMLPCPSLWGPPGAPGDCLSGFFELAIHTDCDVLADLGNGLTFADHCGQPGPGRRPRLVMACRLPRVRVELVRSLLACGADPLQADAAGWTPLLCACGHGRLDLVEVLHTAEAGTGQATEKPVAQPLPSPGECCAPSHTTYDGISPAYLASRGGHVGVLRCLHGLGFDLHRANKNGSTPLYAAAKAGHLAAVRYLHREASVGVEKVNRDGASPAWSACFAGHVEVLRYLHAAGADLGCCNRNGDCTVRAASHQGHEEVLAYLLGSGADPGTATLSGGTAVHAASQQGHAGALRLLKQAGASVEQRTNNGYAPADQAASAGHLQVVRCLHEPGADTSAGTRNRGCTPLHRASSHGHIEVVRCLVELGAHVHATTRSGATPLHRACIAGHLSVVTYLVAEAKARDHLDNKGRTPVHCAQNSGHVDVVRYLCKLPVR
eukprot:gene3439-653_t